MGRHAARPAATPAAEHRWRDRLLLAAVVLLATCLGVVWAGGGWRLGLGVGAGAAVVVVGALALGATVPAPPARDPDGEQDHHGPHGA